ncbi:hypothetical protein ADEAN_000710800 [Angomonas deanei]|uniref:Uncharacterized protein n=1 Tax=Angomonas deanei TaxID=59799 RepID=A0A7G2CJN2_9TRYP|nr:hypothetical protein ADEAN_000710800 [Angomonas deanei]
MSNLEKEATTSQDGLLPRQKYHARTLDEHSSEAKLLTDATMKESKQAAGLRHWRSTNEFSELAIQNERTVVDGVEDLQTATTGLLARHHPELNLDPYDEKEEAKYNAKEAASRSSPTGRYPTIREPGDVSEVLSSSYVTAPANNSVDDRITPQTLKVLLKGSRQTVAKQLAKESHKKANYSYQASADQREKNAKMLRSTALAAKSEEVLTQNNYGNTYTEGTKGATLPRPGTGRRTPTPPPADIVPYYGNSEVNKGTTERVLNSVKYHEPPSITYAQSVKYHAGEEQEGFSQDAKLSSKPPPSNLTYPPTDYSESEELKKKAQAKSRLAPIQIPSRSSRPLKGSGTNREVLQQADVLITEVEASRMVGNDTIELPPKSGKALGLDFAFHGRHQRRRQLLGSAAGAVLHSH